MESRQKREEGGHAHLEGREGQREEERESTVGKARKERRNVTQDNIAQME